MLYCMLAIIARWLTLYLPLLLQAEMVLRQQYD